MSAPTPDTEQAFATLEKMFDADVLRHLVAISEDGKVTARSFKHTNRAAMCEWIDDRQGKSNLYFTVNELGLGVKNRKATKEDVGRALYIHVDVDDASALDRIRKYLPQPTMILFSGGGYQAFWKLREPSTDLARVERINRQIARALGGDNCHNIDRIMRLPGTINVPNAKKRKAGRVPTLAYVVEEATDWSRLYSLNDFDDPTPAAPAAHAVAAGPGTIGPLDLDQLLPIVVSEPLRTLIERGDDAERPAGTAQARFPSRSEAVWSVARELAHAGCAIEQIAGVLLNPSYGISESILEHRKPIDYALRQGRRAYEALGSEWPDTTRSGKPRPTLRNTILAMRRMGLRFAYDQFRYRKTVQGAQIQEYQGDLSDDACAVLRHAIIEEYGFDPGKENSREGAQTLSVENPFHPIREYLDGLVRDGTPRIDRWMTTYMGAAASPLTDSIGRIVLIAAVRRIRRPGAKFDNILVLEGDQGGGKSTAIKILAGVENFSDQDILTLDPKAQMEALEGIWLYEICELEGLSRADTAKVKAFASRAVDQGRPAYARFKEARPRQAILIGTTNDDKYLRDTTGNRRFWPVKVGRVSLDALIRDRDQLWAEAAYWEAKVESLVLAEDLWPLAQVEQESRLEDDPWLDALSHLSVTTDNVVGEFVRVSTADLLTIYLEIPKERQQQYQTKRLAAVMRKLGWRGPMLLKFSDGDTARGYQRPLKHENGNPIGGLTIRPSY